MLSENKEASPEIMDMKQKKKGFRSKEEEGFLEEAEGVFVWSPGAIYGVMLLKGEKQYNKNQGSEINHIRVPF